MKGHSTLGVVTRKSIELGGSLGRASATRRGLFFVTQEALKIKNIPIEKATVAVQGFGNIGSWFTRIIYEAGAKIVAVSDWRGWIYNPKGLDILTLYEYVYNNPENKDKTVVGFLDAKKEISNAELLELEVDVLAPCAIEGQITKENASRIKAKIIVEGANGPTTPEADEILVNKDILILPDILADAGGVTVSYFEWVQGNDALFWSEEEVNKKLEQIMVKAFNEVVNEAKRRNWKDLRMAAYAITVQRVAKQYELRGVFP